MDWTVRKVVDWSARDFEGRGLDSPRLDAELLVSEALGMTRVALYMNLDRPLADEERERIRELVKRRRAREPIAYILGRREFFGRRFTVSPAVLVPRPDTETLVERALELLPEDTEGRALDLCTGSGAIGLTLAAERPGLRVDLTDLSAEALAVARANAEALGVSDRVRLFEGDLAACVPGDARGAYDLVTVNPPYVAASEMAELAPEVRDHEPRLALVADDGGFAIHHRLVAEVEPLLSPTGTLLVEVGAGQAEPLRARLAEAGWVVRTATHADLGGVLRVVEAGRAVLAEPLPAEEDEAPRDEVEDALVATALEDAAAGAPTDEEELPILDEDDLGPAFVDPTRD